MTWLLLLVSNCNIVHIAMLGRIRLLRFVLMPSHSFFSKILLYLNLAIATIPDAASAVEPA